MKINNATPITKNNMQNNTNKNVAFKGLGESATKFLTLNRKGPMTRELFLANAFIFLLGSRLIKSRDKKEETNKNKTLMDYIRNKDEKRETIVRDVPTIIIAVMGVPIIGKWIAEHLQKKTGFAIMGEAGEKGTIGKFIDKLRNKPNQKNLDVLSHGQIDNLYKYDENLASGLPGFSKRLAGLGGNLKKIYSSLSDEIKTSLKDFNGDNNEKFMTELSENSGLSERIKTALKMSDNKALKQASFMKTYTNIVGLGTTLTLLGICIPKMNIALTEALHRNDKSKSKNIDVKTRTSNELS